MKAGDVMILLEDDENRSRVVSGEAMVATLKARLDEMKAGSRPQEIQAADAAVASARQPWKMRTWNSSEWMNRSTRESSPSRSRTARTARNVASSQLESQRKNAELVRIGPRKEQIKAVEAQPRQAEADLDYARTLLGYTEIKAPIDGVILEKFAEQGEIVTNTNFGGTGAKSSVVSMADLACLNVGADVNEADLSKVSIGQQARSGSTASRIRSTKERSMRFPQADRQKGTVQVKVRIMNPEDSIKIEVNARVTFFTPSSELETVTRTGSRAWVPQNAVVKVNGDESVYAVSGEIAQLRKIVTKGDSDRGVEVSEGLEGVDTVVVEPSSRIVDGARIRVMP